MGDDALSAGKLPAGLLQELLAAARDSSPDVLLGPSAGEDAAAIAVPAGTLVAATDPITLTGEGLGRYAVIVNANDAAVTGVRPRWFLCTLLLPLGTREKDVRHIFSEIRRELDLLRASLVGGHTEITPAVTKPVAVGQFLGHSASGRFVRTGGVSPGDRIVQVGPAPIEGTAVLAVECRRQLKDLPAEIVERAEAAAHDPGISVVEPALAAAELGATSLHDPTEGGLATALWEVAEASGVAIEIDTEAVLWFPPGLTICGALGADPWGTLASGTLLAAFPRQGADWALERLRAGGYEPAIIGAARAGRGVYTDSGDPLPRFEPDEVARIITPARTGQSNADSTSASSRS